MSVATFLTKRANEQRVGTVNVIREVVSSKEIRTIERWLNNRPRKCLNFKTPAEAMKTERVALAG